MGRIETLGAVGLLILAGGCAPLPHERVEGEACGCNSDCRADLYCADDAGHDIPSEEAIIGTTCEGHGACVPRRAEGEACDHDVPCAPELFCLHRTPRTCGVAQPAGAACGDSRDCIAGLRCNLALDPVQCSVPVGDGGPCGDDADCSAGLLCNFGLADAGGLCQVPGTGVAGTPCAEDTHCSAGLLCHTTSHCVAAGDTGATWYEGTTVCTAIGTVATGTFCARNEECASGVCNEPATGVCRQGRCD